MTKRRPSESQSFLDTAQAIGAALGREAFWSGDRCSWLGRPPTDPMGGPATVSPIGPDLYSGTAGVGLFLAELASTSGDAQILRTAEGALEQAFATAERVPPISRLGFFSGWIGIGWAAVHAGLLLQRAQWTMRGLDLVKRALAYVGDEHVLDIIGGNAGAIFALQGLDHVAGAQWPSEGVVRLAEDLLARATRMSNTLAWPTLAASGTPMGPAPLTGYAHGAAGMGLALLEASVRTKRRDLIEAADAAFRYEDGWFDERQQNWPDLRGYDATRGEPPSAWALAWCHGAPGIALARLRAVELLPERADHRAAAMAGLDTTLRTLKQVSESRFDVSYCHGIAGLTGVLLMAARVLERPELRRTAAAVWKRLISLHGDVGDWPSGVPSQGPSPSLMLGTAGVGLTLLQLASQAPGPTFLVPVRNHP